MAKLQLWCRVRAVVRQFFCCFETGKHPFIGLLLAHFNLSVKVLPFSTFGLDYRVANLDFPDIDVHADLLQLSLGLATSPAVWPTVVVARLLPHIAKDMPVAENLWSEVLMAAVNRFRDRGRQWRWLLSEDRNTAQQTTYP